MRHLIWLFCAVMMAISGVAMVSGFIWMVWASTLADPGHAFDAGRIPWAVIWTGLVGWVVFGAGYINLED